MEHAIRDLTRDWRSGDAEKLATFEMESSVSWPGGGGWQTTATEAERWIRQGDQLAALVTEDGDRIVSLCTLRARPGQKIYTYIPHLNCHPDYHGKKHGKAVLHAAVDFAYRHGYLKVDLNTWAGNMKAVPLYKKTGFMWRPDTTVFMENFTPMARRHPLGRDFFAKCDWYGGLVRHLDLGEDRMERGRVKVYEYLWRADDGESLRMVFDRQSWGLIEIENGDLEVACTLPDEKLVAGRHHRLQWRLHNKRRGAASVFLTAAGDPGVQIEQRQALQVSGRTRLQADFEVDPDTPKKEDEPKATVIRTDLVWDGVGLDLRPGFAVCQAVDVGLAPDQWQLAPGRRSTVALTVRSNLEETAVAQIEVRPLGNVQVHGRRFRQELAPRKGAEVEMSLTVDQVGAAAIEVAVTARIGKEVVAVKAKRLDLVGQEAGGLAGAVGPERALLCSDQLALEADLRGGAVRIYDRLRGRRQEGMQLHCPQFGPPFVWEDFFEAPAEATVQRRDWGLVLWLRSRSLLRPGVVLERWVHLGQGPLVRVEDAVSNGGDRALQLDRQQGWQLRGRPGTSSWMWAVQGDHVRSSRSGDGGRGLESVQLPEDGRHWPEGWLCRQRDDGSVAGVLWDGAEIVEAGFGGSVKQTGGRLRPGQTRRFPAVAVVVCDGDWQTVRGWWYRVFGEGAPPALPLGKAVDLQLRPEPLVLSGDTVQVRLGLRSAGTHRLDGRLELEPPPGWQSGRSAWPVKDLDATHAVDKTLRLRRGPKAASGAFELRLRTDEAVYRRRVAALVLPKKSAEVTVDKDAAGVWTVDNGLVAAKVAPAFLGAAVSLVRGGAEFLNSSYPTAGVRSWRNPWHGGIHPEYGRLWGRLHNERFGGRAVRRKGAQGLVWQGVRVACTVADERARGQTLSLEYLLAPGAGVLALVLGCGDALGVRGEADLDFNIWPAFAERPGSAAFYTPANGAVEGLAARQWAPELVWRWGGIRGDDGRGLLLAACGPNSIAGGYAGGPEGCVLFGKCSGPFEAGGTVKALYFVVPVLAGEKHEDSEVWSLFEALP